MYMVLVIQEEVWAPSCMGEDKASSTEVGLILVVVQQNTVAVCVREHKYWSCSGATAFTHAL